MKVIISHDVDHLFRGEHYRDLIYPKLWVRSMLEVLRGQYGFREWIYRMHSPFCKIRHHIPELIEFDKSRGIESTFFFGMNNGLGMKYSIEDAMPVIRFVMEQGFEVGVHGIEFESYEKVKKEYTSFSQIVKEKDFGIRTHYVRYNHKTFNIFNKCGYLFDTSEFDKTKGMTIKSPYKVGDMWEFPLVMMDAYLPIKFKEKKERTVEIINIAEKSKIQYLTILFHDASFCKEYLTERDWYIWLVDWLSKNGHEFISYRKAIMELEKGEINE